MFNFHHHHYHDQANGIYQLDDLGQKSENLFSAGIHPNHINNEDWQKDIEQLNQLAKKNNCKAIGECGFDTRSNATIILQKEVFQQQILLANQYNKKVIIHCVRAFDILLPYTEIAKTPLIVHGFNKKVEVARQLIKNGFYLSFGVALLNNLSLQNVFKEIAPDRFFLETDTSDIPISLLYEKANHLRNQDCEQQVLDNLKKIGI